MFTFLFLNVQDGRTSPLTMFSVNCTMQTSWVGLCMIVYFRGIFLFFFAGGGVIKVLRDIDRLIIKIVSMHEQICLAFLRNLKRIKGLMNYGIFLSLHKMALQ